MASPHNPDRWTFEFHTPLGTTRCSYELRDAELVFQSDDPLAGGSDSVRWDRVAEGGTAAMAGMDGRGGPDLPEWVPAELEWLVLSRLGATPGFMHPLPQGDQRHALVAAVRSHLACDGSGRGCRCPRPSSDSESLPGTGAASRFSGSWSACSCCCLPERCRAARTEGSAKPFSVNTWARTHPHFPNPITSISTRRFFA